MLNLNKKNIYRYVKKINTVCAMLLVLSVLIHAGICCYGFVVKWYDPDIFLFAAFSTQIIGLVHITLSIFIFLFVKNGRSTVGTDYKKTIQRVSAIIILILLFLHIKNYLFLNAGYTLDVLGKVKLVITEELFFAAIFVHIASSRTFLLTNLGIRLSDSGEKITKYITNIFCVLAFALVSYCIMQFILIL